MNEHMGVTGARNPREVIEALRTACGKHGEVKRIKLSCSHAPREVVAQIHFVGDAVNAAGAIGGQVSENGQLRTAFTLPSDFCCSYAMKDSHCLCMF